MGKCNFNFIRVLCACLLFAGISSAKHTYKGTHKKIETFVRRTFKNTECFRDRRTRSSNWSTFLKIYFHLSRFEHNFYLKIIMPWGT